MQKIILALAISFSLAGCATSISGNYALSKDLKLTAGINNLFDKRLFRETNSNTAAGGANASAATYNEPGRAFFAAFNVGF